MRRSANPNPTNFFAQGYTVDPSARADGRWVPVPPIPTQTTGQDGHPIRTVVPFRDPMESLDPTLRISTYAAHNMQQAADSDTVAYNIEREMLYGRPTELSKHFDQAFQPHEEIGRTFQDARNYAEERQPIYAPIHFVANTKYCSTPTQATSSFKWGINRNFMSQNYGVILATEDFVRRIVSVQLDGFYVPKYAFPASIIYMGKIHLNIETLIGPDSVSYDYYGPINNISALPKMFTFEINLDKSDALRYYLTPVRPRYVFVTPISATNNDWIISFNTPNKRIITFLPPILYAQVLTAANPAEFTSINHQMQNGDQVSVDTVGLNAVYVPGETLFTVAVLTANTFQLVGLDGTLLTVSTQVQLTDVTRIIRIDFVVTAINDKQQVVDSNRGVLQIA